MDDLVDVGETGALDVGSLGELAVDVPLAPPSLPALPALRVGLGVLTLGALFASLVPVFWVWLGAVTLVSGGTAELLQHTRGLVEANFGAGYWLGLLLNLTFLLWSLVRAVRSRLGARSLNRHVPVLLLVGLYVFVGAPAVLLDVNGVDVPDVVTALFLLGFFQLCWYVLPLAMGAEALRIAWRLVAQARTMPALWTAVARTGVALLGGLSVTGLSIGAAANGYFPALPEDEAAFTVGPSELHAELDEMAATLVGDAEAPTRSDDPFAACIESLAKQDESSTVARAIRRLLRHRLSLDDARDIAYATLLRVCEQDAKAPVRQRDQYYWRAISNAEKAEWRHNCRLVLGETEGFECTYSGPEAEQARRVRAAFQSLSKSDQMMLTLSYVEGYSHREIAELLVISEAASRKRLQRATEALRKAYADRAY